MMGAAVKVRVIAASERDETTFRNLFQYYIYEFSRFTKWRTTAAGRFLEADLDGCWADAGRHPFLFTVDDDLAGLAIVDYVAQSPYYDGQPAYQMAEFFIMAGFQRQGIGYRTARMLFDHYPGHWQIFELEENDRAQAFWRTVLVRYNGGNFTEVPSQDRPGVVQLFRSVGD